MSRREAKQIILPIFGLVGLLLVWHSYVVGFNIPLAVLPAPAIVFDAVIANAPLLLQEGWVTLQESVYGFLLAFFLGIPNSSRDHQLADAEPDILSLADRHAIVAKSCTRSAAARLARIGYRIEARHRVVGRVFSDRG